MTPRDPEDSHPRLLAQRELRFDIWFALSQIPLSLVQAWAGKNRIKRQHARDQSADRVSVRFARYQVRAPNAEDNPMPGIRNQRGPDT